MAGELGGGELENPSPRIGWECWRAALQESAGTEKVSPWPGTVAKVPKVPDWRVAWRARPLKPGGKDLLPGPRGELLLHTHPGGGVPRYFPGSGGPPVL